MAAKRLFLTGLGLMVFFGLGHFTGFLQGYSAARHDPGMAELTRAMQAHTTSALGFSPSILDFREYFSLNFSILMLLAAAMGFAMVLANPDRARVIRRLSPLYIAAMLLLLGTSWFFSVVQGLMICPLIAVVFGLAWWRA